MHIQQRIKLTASLFALMLMVSCVTVNIYFPAAQVEQRADEIVSKAYEEVEEQEPAEDDQSSLSLSRILAWFGPAEAHASSAVTRGLESEVAANFAQLAPYFDTGNLGFDNQGYIAIRNMDGISMQDQGKVRLLVDKDNKTREELYRAVAEEEGADPSHFDRVKQIFAADWQERAKPGWWVQDGSGGWRQK